MKNAVTATLFAASAMFLSASPPAAAAEQYVVSPLANLTLSTFLFGRPSDPGVTVVVLRPHRHDDERAPAIYRYPSTETLARAQNEVAASPAIRDSLERRNIRVKNVMAVQTALDGSKIVYVK